MADRTVKTIFTADVGGYLSGVGRMAGSTKALATSIEKDTRAYGASLAAVAASNERQWSTVSTAAVAAGAGIAISLAATVKAAMDWQSAFAGVTKTVDGSATEMAALEGQLRSLARTLPASHQEIAAVAEAAGQLGVQRSSIADFTKVMIDLGETTNLTADEAATSIAQLMNIMSTSPQNVGRLGSALVALGNDGASTERQIIELAQRIAGAGTQVGLSETAVLGFANAIASTGIEVEAGGTAISRTFLRMDDLVRESGQGLTDLARLAGMSANDFKAAWEKDAAGAMTSVVDGLGRVSAAGGSADSELTKLGITGTREKDTMLRLAAATKSAGASTDLLRDSLVTSQNAWHENTALVDEATKRYETAQSKIRVGINTIIDAAISFGSVAIPAVASLATSVAMVAAQFAALPGPVRTAAVTIAAVAAAALLLGGGMMKAVGYVKNLKSAVDTLRAAMAAANISMKTASLASAGIGLALTVAGAAFSSFMSQQQRAADIADNYAQALEASNGAINENVRATAAKTLADDGALEAAEKLGLSMSDVTDAALGNAEAMERVQKAIDQYKGDKSFDAQSRTDRLTAEGEAAKKLAESLQTNKKAFAEAAAEARRNQEAVTGSASAQDSAGTSTDAATAKFEAQKKEMTGLLEVLQQYGNEMLKLSGDQIALEAAIDGATESISKNGRTLDINTAAGRANQTAINSIASAGQSLIKTLVEQGASTQQVTAAQQRASQSFVAAAVSAGMSRDQAQKLASAYFAIPKKVKTDVTDQGSANASWARVNKLRREIDKLPAKQRSEIEAILNKKGAAAAEAALNKITRDRTVTINLGGKKMGPIHQGTKGKAFGGIMDYYAGGGIRDEKNKHIAEIAPAGAWRVWAEPETDGEAYIPFALDRRPRSRAIATETVRRLGGQVAWNAIGSLSPASINVSSSGITPADLDRILSSRSVTVTPQIMVQGGQHPRTTAYEVARVLEDFL